MGDTTKIHPVSYKGVLLKEISGFLKTNDMPCPVTQDGVCELACRLLNYKEESKALFPEIYIIDDENALKMLSGGDISKVILGKGVKTPEIMLKALKKGAPLCERYWAIYILRSPDQIEYGVFKKEDSLVSLSSADMINEDLGTFAHIIQMQQITNDTILLKGCASPPLLIQFGTDELKSSPLENLYGFVNRIVTKKEDDAQYYKLVQFLKRVFIDVKDNGHGTLSCIVDGNRDYPDFLKDGVILKEPVDIFSIITEGDKSNSLEALFSLISGMLKSDGITVFSDDSRLLAYNVFVKLEDLSEDEKISGGARSRTYLQLQKKVDSGDVKAAYMQTQEGKIVYYGK